MKERHRHCWILAQKKLFFTLEILNHWKLSYNNFHTAKVLFKNFGKKEIKRMLEKKHNTGKCCYIAI